MNNDENVYSEASMNFTNTREETDRKCPDCGGVMDFDPNTGGLACPYCGHIEEIKVEEDNLRADELDFELAEETGNCFWGIETKTVICKSCGGETVYDSLQIAGECPYCGSNQVMEENDKNTLAPGGVCVFMVNQEIAGNNFKSWIGKKLFCPSEAKKKAKPKEFKGVYLPYWTFDTDTTSDFTAKYGKEVGVGKAKRILWHNTGGKYSEFINDQLVMGSKNYDRSILKSIEPFDTENNKAYKPEYIAGFITERYSTGLKDAWEIGKDDIKAKLVDHIKGKIEKDKHADYVKEVALYTMYSNVTYKYLLLPIWISSFKYNGKVYQFMVNGQTGKVGGKTPISPLRVAIAIILVLLLVFLYVYSKLER